MAVVVVLARLWGGIEDEAAVVVVLARLWGGIEEDEDMFFLICSDREATFDF
jgi:hypothetical protein